jgi:uncharacterized OB-fold protein
MPDVTLPQLTLARDEASAGFFDAAAASRLLILRCAACGSFSPMDADVCVACGGLDLSGAAAGGEAELVSWTVVHRAPHPAFAELVPYLVGIVELAEGPWMHARLALTEERARPGLPVRADFRQSVDGEHYPVFVPS